MQGGISSRSLCPVENTPCEDGTATGSIQCFSQLLSLKRKQNDINMKHSFLFGLSYEVPDLLYAYLLAGETFTS